MNFDENKRCLRRIENVKLGLVFEKRRVNDQRAPLFLNVRIWHNGSRKQCTLNWMPKLKLWNLEIPIQYGHTHYMKSIMREPNLKKVWEFMAQQTK